MNRRQKIKNLKKELARYKNPLVKKPVELYPSMPYEIRTLSASHIIAEDNIGPLDDEDFIEYLVHKARHDIRECVEVTKTQKGPFVHYRAELKVVVPRT